AEKPGAARFVSVQNQYSLLHRGPGRGVLATCARLGLGFIPFFPLARGLLTGKYRKGQALPTGSRICAGSASRSAEQLDITGRVIQLAEARGHTILELTLAWLLAHQPVASVIAGATRPEQARANAAAAGWHLSDAERAEIDAMSVRPE